MSDKDLNDESPIVIPITFMNKGEVALFLDMLNQSIEETSLRKRITSKITGNRDTHEYYSERLNKSLKVIDRVYKSLYPYNDYKDFENTINSINERTKRYVNAKIRNDFLFDIIQSFLILVIGFLIAFPVYMLFFRS